MIEALSAVRARFVMRAIRALRIAVVGSPL